MKITYERNRGYEVVCDSKRKNPNANIVLPLQATKNSVGWDIFSPVDAVILPMKSVMIWTDVKAYFRANEALLINVRSSMGKQPVMIANTQGWIESDYYENEDNDGNIGIRLFNLGDTPFEIKAGDRIAQGMFIEWLAADNGKSKENRNGGFGSTKK